MNGVPVKVPGIYRGKCVSSASNGHIVVTVPQVTGSAQVTALPCFSPDYDSVCSGGTSCTESEQDHYDVPKAGMTVWVMYEGGDPDRPVWMGIYK